MQLRNAIDGENFGDLSGLGIAISDNGSIIVIGARQNNDSKGTISGHICLFENISNVWTQVGNAINGEASEDSSGFSVLLSSDGTILTIGAFFE